MVNRGSLSYWLYEITPLKKLGSNVVCIFFPYIAAFITWVFITALIIFWVETLNKPIAAKIAEKIMSPNDLGRFPQLKNSMTSSLRGILFDIR